RISGSVSVMTNGTDAYIMALSASSKEFYCVHINLVFSFFFFFSDTAATEIYTLSLHDALPISEAARRGATDRRGVQRRWPWRSRSEEHTSELQSLAYLVCRLLLEKKNVGRWCGGSFRESVS